MSRKHIGVAVISVLALLLASMVIPPVSNFLWSGFYRPGSFTEELYTSTSCKEGQVRLHQNVGMGGFDAGTQVSYTLSLVDGEGERLIQYIKPLRLSRGEDREILSGDASIARKEVFVAEVDGEDGMNHWLVDVLVRSDTFSEAEYETIRDCLRENHVALGAAMTEANRVLPEPHMIGNSDMQFSGVYYYVAPKAPALQKEIERSGPGPDVVEKGTFRGTYEPYVKFNEELGNVTCHTLAVSEGTPSIVERFKKLIADKNTVQSLTAEGKLRVNLPWSELPEGERSKLLAGNEVTIELYTTIPAGKDAGPCASFLSYSSTTPSQL